MTASGRTDSIGREIASIVTSSARIGVIKFVEAFFATAILGAVLAAAAVAIAGYRSALDLIIVLLISGAATLVAGLYVGSQHGVGRALIFGNEKSKLARRVLSAFWELMRDTDIPLGGSGAQRFEDVRLAIERGQSVLSSAKPGSFLGRRLHRIVLKKVAAITETELGLAISRGVNPSTAIEGLSARLDQLLSRSIRGHMWAQSVFAAAILVFVSIGTGLLLRLA